MVNMKDQLTTMEVNIARTYNQGVANKKAKEEAAAGQDHEVHRYFFGQKNIFPHKTLQIHRVWELTLECTLKLQMEMKRTNVKGFFPKSMIHILI